MAIEGDKLIQEIDARLKANVKTFKMLVDLRNHIENGGECYHPQKE